MPHRSTPPSTRPARPLARAGRGSDRAKDILFGYVREVLDGRTLDVNLLGLTGEQRQRYHDSELVRLVGAVVEGHPAALHADLLHRVHRRRVRCFVHGRDQDGRLLAVAVPVTEPG